LERDEVEIPSRVLSAIESPWNNSIVRFLEIIGKCIDIKSKGEEALYKSCALDFFPREMGW